jgi:hypothetical protein
MFKKYEIERIANAEVVNRAKIRTERDLVMRAEGKTTAGASLYDAESVVSV